jgi:hypothetical protein
VCDSGAGETLPLCNCRRRESHPASDCRDKKADRPAEARGTADSSAGGDCRIRKVGRHNLSSRPAGVAKAVIFYLAGHLPAQNRGLPAAVIFYVGLRLYTQIQGVEMNGK